MVCIPAHLESLSLNCVPVVTAWNQCSANRGNPEPASLCINMLKWTTRLTQEVVPGGAVLAVV